MLRVGVVGDEIRHLVGHHVLIQLAALWMKSRSGSADAGLDHRGHVVAVAGPAPEFERHGQICRTAVVPAPVLVHVNDAVQDHSFGQRGGGQGGRRRWSWRRAGPGLVGVGGRRLRG